MALRQIFNPADPVQIRDMNEMFRELYAFIQQTGGGSIPASGWMDAKEEWTFEWAVAPAYAFSTGKDRTAKYWPGMRVKVTQTTVRYFIIVEVCYVPAGDKTVVTVYGGTDYALLDAAITQNCYSPAKAPAGFPLHPLVWTVALENTTQELVYDPVIYTWNNLSAFDFALPVGVWCVKYQLSLYMHRSTAGFIDGTIGFSTMRTSSASLTYQARALMYTATGTNGYIRAPVTREFIINNTIARIYYINMRTDYNGMGEIGVDNRSCRGLITALCAYL